MNNIETINQLFKQLQDRIKQSSPDLIEYIAEIRAAVIYAMVLPQQSHISELIASMTEIQTSVVE